MHIRCPHCHNPIELVAESSFRNMECPTCGSHFSLIGSDAPTESGPARPRTLAHFQLIEQLGAGHFGTVWKAKDTRLDRFVAVKIPRSEQLDEADIEKFFREARAAAQLRHPNIVAVHEVGRDGNTIFITSDYVEGATLGAWLGGMPLAPQAAARLGATIADALHAAHEAGVIHRDLKPSNIMMDMDGQPHIMDFGIAKRESGEITMTIEGVLLGTPAYMPPEQAAGKGHEADRRSDVYALGVILFEMLTGELPFRGDKRMLLLQIQRDEPRSPCKLNGDVPRDLETICLKCLEKSPDRRYPSARELAEEFKRFLDGKPIAARPVTRLERTWRWCRRQRLLASLIATSILLTLAILVGATAWALRETELRGQAEAESARARDAEVTANQAREQADREQEKTQRSLAERSFQAAQLAVGRGQWRIALTNLDEALQGGYHDPVSIGLERLKVLAAVDDVPRWSQELDALLARQDPGRHAAEIMLWQAIRMRALGDDDEDLTLMQRALEMGLPAADAAFARGMIAETTPEAVNQFEEALNSDPFHHRARSALVGSLFCLGRLPEVRQHATVGHLLFPDDPNFPLVLACAAALEGDWPTAERCVDEDCAQLAEDTRNAMRSIARFFFDMRDFDLLDSSPVTYLKGLSVFLSLRKYAVQRRSGLGVDSSSDSSAAPPGTMFIMVARPVRRAYSLFITATMPFLNPFYRGDCSTAIEAAAEAARIHPEAMFQFIHGSLLLVAKRNQEAENTLAAAAQAPALFRNFNRRAYYVATAAALNVNSAEGNNSQALERATTYVREYLVQSERARMSVTPGEATELVMPPLLSRDFELARRVLAGPLREKPNDVILLRWLAKVELQAGAYPAALDAIEKVLQQRPDDSQAEQLQKDALKKLRDYLSKTDVQ